MDRKKILFFLFGGCGGAERMTVNYGKMLPQDRFETIFVVCGIHQYIVPFIPKEYRTIYIPWHNVLSFPRTRIAYVILREKPSYVFSSTMQLNILLCTVSRFLKTPCVLRNDSMPCFASRLLRKRMTLVYPHAKTIVAQTEEMQQALSSLVGMSKKIICLHNPIDSQRIDKSLLNAKNPYPDGNYTNYLFVANFLPVKAHDVLIKAFSIVHSNNPNARLYFVGKNTGPNFQRVRDIVLKNRLEEFICFVGFTENPYVWMKYADCFVLPSRLEGFPNVLLEALYIRTPVVASVCTPIIDRIIENGYNGYKVTPEDYTAMAQSMEKAIFLKDFEFSYKGATANDVENLFN